MLKVSRLRINFFSFIECMESAPWVLEEVIKYYENCVYVMYISLKWK